MAIFRTAPGGSIPVAGVGQFRGVDGEGWVNSVTPDTRTLCASFPSELEGQDRQITRGEDHLVQARAKTLEHLGVERSFHLSRHFS